MGSSVARFPTRRKIEAVAVKGERRHRSWPSDAERALPVPDNVSAEAYITSSGRGNVPKLHRYPIRTSSILNQARLNPIRQSPLDSTPNARRRPSPRSKHFYIEPIFIRYYKTSTPSHTPLQSLPVALRKRRVASLRPFQRGKLPSNTRSLLPRTGAANQPPHYLG